MGCEFVGNITDQNLSLPLVPFARIRFGKGRDTSSRVQLHLAEELFGSPSTLITQPHGAADARLVLQCHMLDSALRMKELCQYADDVLSMGIELWLSRAAREFKVMGQWQHRLAPVFGELKMRCFVHILTFVVRSPLRPDRSNSERFAYHAIPILPPDLVLHHIPHLSKCVPRHTPFLLPSRQIRPLP
jgi:hypothetical protein